VGMFDIVVFDGELPGMPSQCRRFQTKSLERCLDRYTVTRAGRLCLSGNEMADGEPAAAGRAPGHPLGRRRIPSWPTWRARGQEITPWILIALYAGIDNR
jgi:hypothetical protein